MEYASDQEKILDDEGGWVDTHHFADKGVEEKISEMNLEDASSSPTGTSIDSIHCIGSLFVGQFINSPLAFRVGLNQLVAGNTCLV